MKRFFFYLAIIYSTGISTSFGLDAVDVSVGKASDNIDVFRLSLRHSWSSRWFVSSAGELSGFHAISFNNWEGTAESIQSLAYSPVFIYRFHSSFLSYIKFGVGAAYLSDTKIMGRDLSSYFQFEDQLGMGWKWDEHDLSLVYMHYSNAGIEDPNHGIDMLLLSYAYSFD